MTMSKTASQFPVSQAPTYPGGSRSRVNRAGDRVRAGVATEEDFVIIDEWRAAHRAVLNTFQAILRTRTRHSRTVVAQRHKRRLTIFDKLERIPSMQLSRMDDIAGCRLIFRSISELRSFRSQLHTARFNHKRKNDPDKYDYIQAPKSTGYRGIHDVYEYDVNSETGRKFAGLFVEIQYRTRVQHAWATAVEVIGFITESQPKFQKGDVRYETAMAYASEILARHYEKSRGPCPNISDREVAERFLALDSELGLLQMLRGLNSAQQEVSDERNAILIFSADRSLEIRTFRDAPEALRALFELERTMPTIDVVLVRADKSSDVRLAFKNYFSDSKDFIELIENGCARLSHAQQLVQSNAKPRKSRS
jgi:putative GTP pyrophosphokinase